MAHGQRAAKIQKSNLELWSRRPLSGYDATAANKRLSRRIERHITKTIIADEMRSLKEESAQ